MVRRKSRDVESAVPGWVMRFDPFTYESRGGINGWRQEIRDWCKSVDLQRTDPNTWMSVVRNFVAESHARQSTDPRPEIQSAIRAATNMSYESEAH